MRSRAFAFALHEFRVLELSPLFAETFGHSSVLVWNMVPAFQIFSQAQFQNSRHLQRSSLVRVSRNFNKRRLRGLSDIFGIQYL
ncbi:hypothetical protein GE061_019556 [Apolygus lucorum]|uniref:Uncharacterized protein n=1 Tax=Apolygus lucorum TaxID=248454 RepID=A0A6A4JR51_APOLU|nr:hypothetical protein GE061_019556 [Apolygus lucorum]